MDQQKVGKFIASVRKEKNWTQAQLGDKLGVTDKTISKWETGTYMPDLSLLKSLSETLGVSIYELLDGERMPNNDVPVKSKGDILLDALKSYVGSVKKSMMKKGAIIVISTVIVFIAIIGFMLVKNNYDNCYIYSLSSQDENYLINGLFTSTPEKNVFIVNYVENSTNFDLDTEMFYSYEYLLQMGEITLHQTGDISSYEHTDDNNCMYLNNLLQDIRIYIEEDKNYGNILKFDGHDAVILKINYINQNVEKKSLEIPFKLIKLFSNNKISYYGGEKF